MTQADRDPSRPGLVKSLVERLSKGSATRPGEIYGVPGEGDTRLLSVATICLLIAVWWLVTWMGWVKPLFVPSPGAIVEKFVNLVQSGFTGAPLWEHVLISMRRVFGAFLLACVIGIPLGLAMGMSPIIRGIFDPPIEFYRPIPPLAYLPLMIIWFGIGETSKVLLIFLSVFAPVALGARSGVRSAGIEQIHAAYSFGASRWRVMRHVILPSAMPNSDRHAGGHRLWLDHAGGGRDGGCHDGHRLHGAVGLSIPADLDGDRRHHHHRGHRLCLRHADALYRTQGGSMEGQDVDASGKHDDI